MMPNTQTYREWLSHKELPLQALIDLLEGVEPSAADCKLLERYKLHYTGSPQPVGLFSEEEVDDGLFDGFCESLLRIAHNGHRSSRFMEIFAQAERSLHSGKLQPSSRIRTSGLRGFAHAIPPLYWLAPQAFFRWARSSGFVFPPELTEALPDYSTWPNMETWPLHAACSLAFDIAPPPTSGELSGNPKKLYELADNSRERLKVKEGRVEPLVFIAWALELGYGLPPELEELADGGPPYAGDEEAREPQFDRGSTHEAGESAACQGAEDNREKAAGRVLDEANADWREVDDSELGERENDESIVILVKDRRVMRAPEKPVGMLMNLTPSEHHLFKFYALHRDAWHCPREGHRGSAANATDMLKRLRRKIDPRKVWFRREQTAQDAP